MEQKDTIEAFNQSYDKSLEDRNPDSAILLAQKVLSFKEQIHNQEVVFRALTNAGLAHERLRQPDSTARYYDRALQLAYLMNKPSKIAFALQMRGNLQIDQKKYKSAEQSFFEALEINSIENDSSQMAANYAGIGLARSSMGEPDSATASYLQALKIFNKEKDVYNQAIILGNIAAQFIEQYMHYKAEPYLRDAMRLNDSLDNHFSLAENSIRPVALGRKNYLFAGSHDAAQNAAMIYSLLATCKINEMEPFEWLRDVLNHIPDHPANKLHELLPRQK